MSGHNGILSVGLHVFYRMSINLKNELPGAKTPNCNCNLKINVSFHRKKFTLYLGPLLSATMTRIAQFCIFQIISKLDAQARANDTLEVTCSHSTANVEQVLSSAKLQHCGSYARVNNVAQNS